MHLEYKDKGEGAAIGPRRFPSISFLKFVVPSPDLYASYHADIIVLPQRATGRPLVNLSTASS